MATTASLSTRLSKIEAATTTAKDVFTTVIVAAGEPIPEGYTNVVEFGELTRVDHDRIVMSNDKAVYVMPVKNGDKWIYTTISSQETVALEYYLWIGIKVIVIFGIEPNS